MSGAKTDETPSLTARIEFRFGIDRFPTRRPEVIPSDPGHRHVGTRGSRTALSLVDEYPGRIDSTGPRQSTIDSTGPRR